MLKMLNCEWWDDNILKIFYPFPMVPIERIAILYLQKDYI